MRITKILIVICFLIFTGEGRAADETEPPSAYPLHDAVLANDIHEVHRLLKQKIDIDAFNDEGYSPLQLAVKDERLSSIWLLLKSGANPNILNFRSSRGAIKA